MRGVRTRTRHIDIAGAHRGPAPAADVDDVEQSAIARDEEDRAQTICKTKEAFDRCEGASVVWPVPFGGGIRTNGIRITFQK
jgi:hypothetical protein